MTPVSLQFDQSTIATLLELDPIVASYRRFFSFLDWSVVDRWQAARSSRGRPGHPESASLKACLIRIKEGFSYASDLRTFLVNHPLLVLDLGFHLVLDPACLFGFDVERTVPCRYWWNQKLRDLDRTVLQDLLASTVAALQAEIPGLGETVAFDMKHLYAWVKENNERAYVPERYDKTRRLAGDPDCLLGVKRRPTKSKLMAPLKKRKKCSGATVLA